MNCNCPDPKCIGKTSCGVDWLDKVFEPFEEVVMGNEEIVASKNILALKRNILAAMPKSRTNSKE